MNAKVPFQLQKVIERLFVFVDNKDIELNSSINLVVNPEILKILFNMLEHEKEQTKLTVMQHISQIYDSNPFNSIILAKRDRQIIQFNYSLLDDIVTFVLHLKNAHQLIQDNSKDDCQKQTLSQLQSKWFSIMEVNQPKEVKKIKRSIAGKLIIPFVREYPICCRNIKNVIGIIAKDFNEQKCRPQLLESTLQVLKQMLGAQIPCRHPASFFAMYGEDSGIKLSESKIKWPFAKGFHLAMIFYLQSHRKDLLPPMSLFSCKANKDSFDLYIDEHATLHVRCFNQSRALRLVALSRHQWHFLRLSYVLKTGIISNSYDLTVNLDGESHGRANLPVPNISIKNQIQELSFGRDFYGRINVAVVSRSEVKEWSNNNLETINHWTDIQRVLVCTKRQIRDFFLLYHAGVMTEVEGQEVVYDITSQNHGELLGNTAVHVNPFATVDVNYYAGIYTYLPFLHILKFYKWEKYPSALEDVLALFLLFFKERFPNAETEALNCCFCTITAQLINELDSRFLSFGVIETLGMIKAQLSLLSLQKDFFLNLLWKVRVRKLQEAQVAHALFSLIGECYESNFAWSYPLVPLDEMLRYAIDNFQPLQPQLCCWHHCLQLPQTDPTNVLAIDHRYRFAVKFQNLLKLVFVRLPQHPELLTADTKNIFHFLLSNYSLCFKQIVLSSLLDGLNVDLSFYRSSLNLLPYLLKLITVSTLPHQFQLIINLFCIFIENQPQGSHLYLHIANQTAARFQLLYQNNKLHSQKKRRMSINIQYLKNMLLPQSLEDSDKNKHFQKQKEFRQMKELKKQKIISLGCDQKLFKSIIKMCFKEHPQQKNLILIDDALIDLISAYFALCGLKNKTQLISLLINTAILIPTTPKSKNVRLVKFCLVQLILEQLSQQEISDEKNYIQRKLLFIIDQSTQKAGLAWDILYRSLLELSSILELAKKQVLDKSEYSIESIRKAARICIRKFLFRIMDKIKRGQEDLFNFIFLIFIVIFSVPNAIPSASEQQDIKPTSVFFQYFSSIEKYILVDHFTILSKDIVRQTNQATFVDCFIVLELTKIFHFPFGSFHMSRSQVLNIVNDYFDLPFQENDQYLTKYRKLFLAKAEVRKMNEQSHILRQMLSTLFVNNQTQEKEWLNHGEILAKLLGLCVETCAKNKDMSILKEAVQSYLNFFRTFVLACSRSNVDKTNPKQVAYSMLHLIHHLLFCKDHTLYKQILEETFYHMLCWLGLVISSLHDRLGSPQKAEQILFLSTVIKNVDGLNFFVFQVLQGIITPHQLRKIPLLTKDQAMKLIQNSAFKEQLRKPRDILHKICVLRQEHSGNINQIEEQIKKETIIYNAQYPRVEYNEEQFERGVLRHLRTANLQYRSGKHVWRKVWKRLRLYHYFWSTGMNQSEQISSAWQKEYRPTYRHKFSKFTDSNGARSILQVQPYQPWHVKKAELDDLFEYRSANYLFGLHPEQSNIKKTRSFFQKVLSKGQHSQNYFYVEWIKHNSKRKGRLSVVGDKLSFAYSTTLQKDSHLEFTRFVLAEYKPMQKQWPLVEIRLILPRRYIGRKQCLLLQFIDDTSLLLNFLDGSADDFVKALELKQAEKSQKIQLMRLNNVEFFTRSIRANINALVEEAMAQWRMGKMSNFKYLMLLNKYAGRSFLDPSNYPVFPWVAEHSSAAAIESRDLSRPVGSLGSESRRDFYRNKLTTPDPFNPVPPYQYGTHYSSPGMLFNFLIRLLPYTEASRTLQGGRYDLPDRLFSSLRICWNSVTTEVSDVRELTPQFFYLPEMLLNIEHHNFGLTQQGLRIHHVQLPAWAKDPFQYIFKHRNHLQSDAVTQQLPQWIDLIFGYKQKGKLAQESSNVFFYLTYENAIDLDQIKDEQTRISTEAQIMHFGQTPTQILSKPHPLKLKTHKKKMTFTRPKFLFSLNTKQSVHFLSSYEGRITLLKNFMLIRWQQKQQYQQQSEIALICSSSKENLYTTEQLDTKGKISLFHAGKLMAIGAYVNGNLIIYNTTDGRKVEQKKGHPKSCIYVNQAENLLFCGCKNGLLEVYEIIYGQKDSVTLLRISAEYYMATIKAIFEGGNFFAVVCGNFVIINKIHRSLSFVYEKIKMKGFKMIRSFQATRQIQGALLCFEPLFCVVFYTTIEIFVYSINGQLILTKPFQIKIPPKIIKDNYFSEFLVVLQERNIVVLSTPYLNVISTVGLPSEIFQQLFISQQKCYIVTNLGSILCITQNEEEEY